MDQDTQAQLNAILAKEVTGLTAADAEFLQARRDYLSEDQQKTYAKVLAPDAPTTAKKKADPAE